MDSIPSQLNLRGFYSRFSLLACLWQLASFCPRACLFHNLRLESYGRLFLVLHGSSSMMAFQIRWCWGMVSLVLSVFWEVLNGIEMSDITATYVPFMLFPNSWPCLDKTSAVAASQQRSGPLATFLAWKWTDICTVLHPLRGRLFTVVCKGYPRVELQC